MEILGCFDLARRLAFLNTPRLACRLIARTHDIGSHPSTKVLCLLGCLYQFVLLLHCVHEQPETVIAGAYCLGAYCRMTCHTQVIRMKL